MKNYLKFLLFLFLVIPLAQGTATAQSLGEQEIWNKKQLIEPSALMAILKSPTSKKPPIFNIGFVSDIPGSKNLGAARDKAGLDNLKEEVKNISKEKLVVIYCGCCPFKNCPNVRPAYDLLKTLGYTNTKIINLPTSLKADWIDKGYPVIKN